MKNTENELYEKIAAEVAVHKFIFENAAEGYCLYEMNNLDNNWYSKGLHTHISRLHSGHVPLLEVFQIALKKELEKSISILNSNDELFHFSFDFYSYQSVNVVGAVKISDRGIAVISIGALECNNISSKTGSESHKNSERISNEFDTLKFVVDNSSAFFLVKMDGPTRLIKYANHNYTSTMGMDWSEEVKYRFCDGITSQEVEDLKSTVKFCENNPGRKATRMFSCRTANQLQVEVEWEFFAMENSKERDSEIICVGTDVTTRSEVERKLREERNLLRTIIDIAPVNIFALDREGRKTIANSAEIAFVGAKNESEVLGKKDEYFFSEAYLKNKMGRNLDIVNAGKPVFYEGMLPNAKGEERRLTGSKSPIFNNKNEVIGLVGVSVDITERYIVEQNLKKREAQFRFIAENISSGIKIIENDLTVYVSPRFEQLFGYSAQEHIECESEDFFNFIHPEDLGSVRTIIQNALHSQKPGYNIQYRYKHKNGHYVWREDSVSVNTDPKIGLQRAVILTTDITSKRKDDELLQFIKFSLENTFDGILWINEDGALYFVNNTACQILGYSQDELLTKTISSFDSAKRGKNWSSYFEKLKKKKILNTTAKFLTKNGDLIEVEVSANFVEYKGKAYNCSFIKDITQNVKNEEALRISDEMLKIVSNLSKIGGWTLNLPSQSLSWTEVTKKIMEVPSDFVPSFNSTINFYVDKPKIKKLIKSAIETGKPWKSDHKIITAKGNEIWVESIGNVEIVDGRAINLFGSLQDITDKKLAKIELERKNKLLEIIAKGSQQLLHSSDFILNLKPIIGLLGDSLNVDRVYLFQANYKNSVLSSLSPILEWGNSDIKPIVDNKELQELPIEPFKVYFDTILQGEAFKLTLGNIANVEILKLFNSQGTKSILIFPLFQKDQFWGFLGFDDCKTERIWNTDEFTILSSFSTTLSHALTKKSAEDKIKESQNLLQKLTNNIPGAVFQFELTKDKRIIFPFVSRGVSKLFDTTQVEIKNEKLEHAFNFIHTEDIDGFRNSVLMSAESLSEWDREFRIVSGNEVRWFRGSSVPERTADNSIVWYGYIQDINENRLKNDSLNKLVEITSDQNQRLLNFAYIISHNIRSHTSNISSLLNIWQLAADQNEQELYLNMLHQSMEKLEETIFNLNQIITIQRELNLPRVKLSIKKEVERAVMSVSSDISNFRAQIEINIPNEIFVMVVPAYLDSILINLITNALKYRSHERALIVKISVKKLGKNVLLQVADNGRGIDVEKYGAKIFGLYKTFHGNEDARGVGLFLVKNQIESMRGRIELDSAVGVGSTFKVFFNDEE
jgi:PAS domain S-box-containing protein